MQKYKKYLIVSNQKLCYKRKSLNDIELFFYFRREANLSASQPMVTPRKLAAKSLISNPR